jgi:hypothetical protein
MARWLPALLLGVAWAPFAAAAGDAVESIDRCIQRLDPSLDVGYARIAERCPDLASTLSGSAVAAWLPRDWTRPTNELSAAGLAELRTLLVRPPPRGGVRAPQVMHVAAVLAGITGDEHPRGTWWTRFTRWLHEAFARPATESGSGWLANLLAGLKVPQGVLQLVTVLALGGVVLLACTIVLNELRVAGWLRGFGRARRTAGRRAAIWQGPDDLARIEQVALGERPRMLLELIAARLFEGSRAPPPGALTVQELVRAVRFTHEADRTRLSDLARICERVRFGGEAVPDSTIAAAVADGRELLAALAAPPLQGIYR